MLSEMQFPGEDWDRFEDRFRRNKIFEIRSENAAGENDGRRDPIYNGLGQQIGTGLTWHDREELRTRQYFHGSPTPIPIGEHIVPGDQIGKHNYADTPESRNDSVFTTPKKRTAAYMALFPLAQQRMDAENGGNTTAYVHEVIPEGLYDTQLPRHMEEYQSGKAKVIRRWKIQDGQPIKEAQEEFDPEPESPHEQLKLDL